MIPGYSPFGFTQGKLILECALEVTAMRLIDIIKEVIPLVDPTLQQFLS